MVGQSEVAFRVRLHRAKRRLRKRLEARESSSRALGLVATELALTREGVKR